MPTRLQGSLSRRGVWRSNRADWVIAYDVMSSCLDGFLQEKIFKAGAKIFSTHGAPRSGAVGGLTSIR